MHALLWSILLCLAPISVTANYPPPVENRMGDDNCDAYAKQGWCKNEAKFMAEFCEKSYHDCILEQAREQAEAMAQPQILQDSLDENICKQMAKEEKCETQPKIMADFCAKTCHDLIMSMSYFKSVIVDDDDEEQFFDLTAKNWTGSTLHFGSFDGYVSIEYI